jgi:hypothetical protein
MTIGSAFTLFVVPSIYVLVARTHAAAPEIGKENALPELVEAAG